MEGCAGVRARVRGQPHVSYVDGLACDPGYGEMTRRTFHDFYSAYNYQTRLIWLSS